MSKHEDITKQYSITAALCEDQEILGEYVAVDADKIARADTLTSLFVFGVILAAMIVFGVVLVNL